MHAGNLDALTLLSSLLKGLSCSLQAAKVPLNEYEFPTSKLANVQSQLEKLVEKNYYLHQSAKDAYRSYLLSYNSHQLKTIFNVHALDLAAVGKSFGFARPPRTACLHTRLLAHTICTTIITWPVAHNHYQSEELHFLQHECLCIRCSSFQEIVM